MKRLILLILATLSVTAVFSQKLASKESNHEIFLKGGIGTSWIILPKVFIVDPQPPNNNAQILPAINGLNGFVGVQTVLHLGNGWLFVPELDLSYTSGEIRVDLTQYVGPNPDTVRTSQQNLQSYLRAEIPLHFGVRSRDGFWVSFGPTLYFTLFDNNGFEEAVFSLPARPDLALNSQHALGVRFRLAAYAPIGDRSYVEFKFESDLGQYFTYENDAYDVRFSFQNFTIGYGYRLNK